MCGRFLIDNDLRDLSVWFNASTEQLPFSWDHTATPGSVIPVIIGSDKRRICTMKWGLVPHWARDPALGRKMFNARAESIDSKPSFAQPFAQKRCLIPATGFFEWKKTDEGKPIPYLIRLKDKPVFSFAGLYDEWKDPEGYPYLSCSIITTSPNDLILPIHDRMPVILAPGNKGESVWLTPTTPKDTLLSLLRPYPADLMTVNSLSS